jgi:isoleucyl-tRNA synthetase
VAIQKEQFKSLGVVADWEHPYLTMDPQFEANTFRAVNTLAQKGYLFEGLKPVFWSWAERTALAEAEVEYHGTDTSVFVAFPNWKEEIGLLVWTTTPWTLPANVAVAVNPELYYVEVEVYLKEQNGRSYPAPLYVAENLVPKLKEKGLIGMVLTGHVARKQGKDLKFTVEHPLNNTPVPIVCADFVSDKDGTGCVHIAPAHGTDDYEVGQKYNLPKNITCPHPAS